MRKPRSFDKRFQARLTRFAFAADFAEARGKDHSRAHAGFCRRLQQIGNMTVRHGRHQAIHRLGNRRDIRIAGVAHDFGIFRIDRDNPAFEAKGFQVADHPIAARLPRQVGVSAPLRRADDGDGFGRDQRREIAPRRFLVFVVIRVHKSLRKLG